MILKEGRLVVYCNLEEERKANKKFLMLETRGELQTFVQGVSRMGAECAVTSDHRLRIILQDGNEIRDLYRLAADSQVQIRRLAYKRDSLEDIFLKAMENGNN